MSHRSARLLLPLGTIALVAIFTFAHATQIAANSYNPLGTFRSPWTVVFTILLVMSGYAVGLPDLPRSRMSAAGLGLVSFALAVVGVSVFQSVVGSTLLPRAVMLGVGLTIPPWSVLVWHTQSDVAQRSARRVTFVGRNEDRVTLSTELNLHPDPPALVTSYLSAREAAQDDGLLREVVEQDTSVIVLGLDAQDDPRVVSQAASLHQTGVQIRTLSLFTEEYLGKLPVADLERVALLFDVGELHRLRYQRSKRVADIVVSLLAMPVLLVVAAPVWLMNLVSSRGPLFYRQERIGKAGEPFTIYKFRSMTVSDDTSWTVEGDDRITPVGRFLRRSHLDELPQLLNIFRGDLSLVGPRPEQTTYVEELREKIPFYDVRHLVRPGLTGWAQVRYAYGSDTHDALEKLQYDLYYLRRQSIATDLMIVVRTLRAVLRGTGR